MQIKTLKFIALLGAIIASGSTFGQTWYWTSQADSSTSQTASQVAVDRDNNPVYTGYCTGTRIAFGNIGCYITDLQSDFLVKYNTNGAPLWARNATPLNSSAQVYGMSVSTDRNKDIVESGYFTDSLAFGAYHVSAKSATNTFLVKYDRNGNALWAAAPTISTTEYSNQNYCVNADKFNNVFITGYFQDTIIFGKDTLTSGGVDLYLVKYDQNGNVLWARAPVLQNGGSTYGLSVTSDDSGNAYIAGNVYDTAIFGNIKIGATGAGSVFIAKYDSGGNAKWAQNTTATPGQILPTPVIVDRSNNVYLGAQFTNASIRFGAYTVTDGASPSCSNALLVKYTPNGNVIWATCADFISTDEVCVIIESAVATDHCNNVYWSGLCSDSFGVGNVKVTVPYGASHPSVAFAYVIKLDSNANPIAGAALGNQNTNSFSNYLAVDSLSKALFVSELVTPAKLIVGNDTVHRYSTYQTAFISKFAVIPTIMNKNNNDSICAGDSLLLSLNAVKGTTYTWSTGATTDSIYVKPTVSTTFFVAVNDGCIIDTSFIKVVVTPSPTPKITGKDSICKGDTVLLSASGGIKYTWSTSQTTDSIKVSPPINATYTLSASSGGCSKDTTFTVHVVPTPTAVISPANDTICQGDSIKLTGSGGSTYKWSNGSTSSSIWVKPDSATTYYLKAYSGTCNDSTKTEVYITPKITAAASIIDSVICPFDTAYLAVTSSGGPATYKWSTSSTSSAIMVTPGVTTTYTVTAYGKCDSLKFTKTVTVIPLPQPVITATSTVCYGSKDTLSVSSATNPTKYLWSNGKTTTSITTGDIKGDSTIYVTATNSLGCAVKDSFKIDDKLYPTGTLTYPLACSNYPTTITAHASGPGPITYKWSTGGTYDTVNVLVGDSTTYTVVISNGCPITKTITIVPNTPTLFACCNTTILVGNDTTITASGANTYSWLPTTGLNCDTCSTVIATPTVTTTYTVTGTDAAGCTVERVVTIVVEIPCLNFTVPNVFTPNDAGPLGFNNVFYIKTENVNAWSISIFDRWGKEMYKSSNPLDYWQGTTEGGANAPDGVYYYIISASCQDNTYKKDGFVQLIR